MNLKLTPSNLTGVDKISAEAIRSGIVLHRSLPQTQLWNTIFVLSARKLCWRRLFSRKSSLEKVYIIKVTFWERFWTFWIEFMLYRYVVRQAWLNILSEHITAGRINSTFSNSSNTDMFLDMHGLIFYLSMSPLAGSTRYLKRRIGSGACRRNHHANATYNAKHTANTWSFHRALKQKLS